MKRFRLQDTLDHITDQAITDGARTVPRGSVFVVVRGMILAHTFRVCVAEREMSFNQDVKAIVANESVHGDFLAHWLKGHSDQMLRLVTEATHGTKRIELSALRTFPLVLPPLDEQRQIAEVLDTLDNAIRQSEQLVAKLKQMKQGLVHTLLTRGIDNNGELRDPERHPEEFQGSPLGGVPVAWTVLKLGEVVPRAVYGISVSLEAEQGAPVLRMNNLKDGEADLSDLKYSASQQAQELLLRPGDVLFNRTNSIEHVGRTGIWRGQLEKASFASYLVRLEPDGSRLSGEFLNRWLNWEVTQIRIRRVATPGVHQVNINPTNLRKTMIALPKSTQEQEQIASILMAHDMAMTDEGRELVKLRLIKQGLMEDLLTGRVRVTDLVTTP